MSRREHFHFKIAAQTARTAVIPDKPWIHTREAHSNPKSVTIRKLMPAIIDNPFTALSLIGAPAILTNASSLLALSTSNRFAHAIDRARVLTGLLQKEIPD